MNTVLSDLKNTFLSIDSYKEFIKAPFSRSIKPFLLFFTILAVLTTIFYTVTGLIPLNAFVSKLPTIAQEIYPQELKVSIKNGEASTNVKEPYAIPMGQVEEVFDKYEDKNVKGAQESDIVNLLVIDTNGNIDDFSKYKTFALLTKKNVSILKNDDRIETISLDKIENLQIDRATVKMFTDKAAPLLKSFLPLVILATFVGMLLFYTLWKMAALLWFALIILLISLLTPNKLAYGKAYQLGLHLTVVVVTITTLLSLFKLGLHIPFFESILFAVMAYVVLSKIKTDKKIDKKVVAKKSL
ncbi:MAG: DUF1189 family protein [Patescibacteria group bacterium]